MTDMDITAEASADWADMQETDGTELEVSLNVYLSGLILKYVPIIRRSVAVTLTVSDKSYVR